MPGFVKPLPAPHSHLTCASVANLRESRNDPAGKPARRRAVGPSARLETTPRDPDAERAIADGARRAPHALYALVQTALVQDEALKLANARIEELQAELDGPPEPAPRQGGFLDSMREAFGGREPRGSVPSVRAQNQSQSYQSQGYPPQGYQSGASKLSPDTRRLRPAMPAAQPLAAAVRSSGLRLRPPRA